MQSAAWACLFRPSCFSMPRVRSGTSSAAGSRHEHRCRRHSPMHRKPTTYSRTAVYNCREKAEIVAPKSRTFRNASDNVPTQLRCSVNGSYPGLRHLGAPGYVVALLGRFLPKTWAVRISSGPFFVAPPHKVMVCTSVAFAQNAPSVQSVVTDVVLHLSRAHTKPLQIVFGQCCALRGRID